MKILRIMSIRIPQRFYFLLGLPKTRSTDQTLLTAKVVNFVNQFVSDFTSEDVLYVRSMRSTKTSIFNIQCRSVTRATLVKSTFASLVKSDDKPDYLEDVSISYSHSLGTRIRLSLMRSISKRQREKDSKAICSVTSFTARPMMRWVLILMNFLQIFLSGVVEVSVLFQIV